MAILYTADDSIMHGQENLPVHATPPRPAPEDVQYMVIRVRIVDQYHPYPFFMSHWTKLDLRDGSNPVGWWTDLEVPYAIWADWMKDMSASDPAHAYHFIPLDEVREMNHGGLALQNGRYVIYWMCFTSIVEKYREESGYGGWISTWLPDGFDYPSPNFNRVLVSVTNTNAAASASRVFKIFRIHRLRMMGATPYKYWDGVRWYGLGSPLANHHDYLGWSSFSTISAVIGYDPSTKELTIT